MYIKKQGLYDPANEHDSCGVGFVVNIDGKKAHKIIAEGIQILCNLEHRGAVGGDLKTGDGAGMLLQIPDQFFRKSLNFTLPEFGKYGVGVLFLPQDKELFKRAQSIITDTIVHEGGQLLGWRDVPVDPDCLGEVARESVPRINQIFISFDKIEDSQFDRKLYIIRKCLENEAKKIGWDANNFYIPSFSRRTIIYKGMFVASQFACFYPDLVDKNFKSAIALVHQRYSTNTFPSWSLAQPFRYIAHNGEINTLRGNVNKMIALDYTLSSPLFGDEIKKIFPVMNPKASDSAIFDNVFELLTMAGRSMEHSMMMMVPEAFGFKYHISQDKRAFYEYHMSLMDPWDGPAALAFSDGIKIGAYLDRNGLRPGRYVITKSGKVVLASETGVLDIDPADVREKGKLAPGKMFLVDTEKQRIIRDNEIKSTVSRWKPYRRWLEENKIELKGLFQVPGQIKKDKDTLGIQQKAFGYSLEDFKTIILPMVTNSQEPVGSMGNDAALAVLSKKPQLIYNYFKQTFAQVTNPPIDPYRENLVMSLSSFVGRNKNLLEETPEHCRQLKLSEPTLTNEDIDRLKHSKIEGFKVCSIPMLFEPTKGALEKGLIKLCLEAEKKVDEGYSMIIISDRDITIERAAIPALLAVARVHQHLLRRNKRGLTALIVETGECREVHHFATLLSFGASGVNPYLVFESLPDLQDRGYIPRTIPLPTAIMNYMTAVNKGLLKVMSKMGISTLRSYRHAQTFEAIGLDDKFVGTFFPGTVSRIGGIGLQVFEKEIIHRHFSAFNISVNGDTAVSSGGNYAYRQKEEQHLYSPEVIVKLQEAVRGKGDYQKFKSYSNEVNTLSKNLCTLRGLFGFKKDNSIPIDEVEKAESIVKRFVTSAMSLGSISQEAHQTLAIAMNRIGAKSNSGEGGEDEKRYRPLSNGDSTKSKVKQVASARFGVTSNYLVNSDEIQIKMAQGAKPGEGGQLPGFKVSDMIARVRHSTPGVMLISPPPHHDIYSIEDLSQLIFDLKCANPEARISVKLVSEVGVGTIAAGVAKGKADMILISGGDGGTGASPLSSIKHTGSSWEIGLAETQQVLVMNKLRGRVRLQVDGQIKTGRDVVVGALLGAEEFGFGSTALVTLGCIMMRKCHLNSCPVGVATQDSELRKRFNGKPESVVNFMFFIAQEVREYMAELGFRTFDEMVGQVEKLTVKEAITHYKAKGLDFSKILFQPPVTTEEKLYCVTGQVHDLSSSLDNELISKCSDSLDNKKPIQMRMDIHNYNRATGATLSSVVSKRYHSRGLPDDTISVSFSGSAGQSFGAFLAPGITFRLEGDANDYLGKGLSGGKIIVYPPKTSTFRPENNIISGNVNLFGATSGEVYINGQVGERFCVRNSGALAVVEGVGDHGCEYMTGGRVIVLGKTGVNFAAGMSGGIAFVLDENQLFDTRCNLEMVDIEPVSSKDDIKFLVKYLRNHIAYTNSRLARELLNDWEEFLPYFVKVMPVDYRRALERIEEIKYEDTGVVGMTEEVFT
jgi:glutamate synthase domain-containing protein 2/glutamate synthase domain-containing protein 1/glutamate synthase domain-containing protein 3